jgi:hypothetical protein
MKIRKTPTVLSVCRIDIIGINGNEGVHYMTKFCKDCKSFKRRTFTLVPLFGKNRIYEHSLELGVCTDQRQELPVKYLVTGDIQDMSYATVVRIGECKGDWYVGT